MSKLLDVVDVVLVADVATRVATKSVSAAAVKIARVPTICRFHGIVIAMYFDDHGVPHFHARHADGEAKIAIDDLDVVDSTLGRTQLRLVLAWAELHQPELHANWRRARDGETLKPIEPLR